MANFIHDPQASLRYGFNWQGGDKPWLDDGDTIATSTWTITRRDGTIGDATLVASESTHDDTTTSVKLTGGTLDKDYRATNHVVSANGYADDRTHVITIRNR